MQLDTRSSKPIFQQIAEFIEGMIPDDEIEDQVYSTNQLSKLFTINPATARKGLTLLSDQKIIYKKRGIGMFVNDDVKTIILEKRQGIFFDQYVQTMMSEAKKIGLDKKDIIEFINNYKEITMNFKKIAFLITSILIFLFSLSFSFSHYLSEFSMNSPVVTENHASTFRLNSNAELYFKYTAKNLTPNSSISLVNDDTEEIVFSFGDQDNSEIFLTDIPAGMYSFNIKYTDGFMSFKILTKKNSR